MADVPEPRATGAGAWLSRFKLDEFKLLNRRWLRSDPDRAEALRRFHEEGVRRLVPIAFDARFEPDYYREVHPEYAGLSDEAAYRQWLFVDLERGWPGSAEEHLGRLGLRLSAFPAGFDWESYVGAEGIDRNRWFALEHLVAAGAPAGGLPVQGPDAARFAVALGLVYRGRDDRSAIAAFEQARASGDRSYLVAHQLADARFRRGEWGQALRLFQEAGAHPDADEVWTYVNGARAAMRLGAYRAAAALLRDGASRMSAELEWRRAVHELVEARFAARTRRARALYAHPEGRLRADRLITEAAETAAALWDALDPVGAPLPGGRARSGPVLIFANYDIPACVHYRVEQKVEQLRALGRRCEVYRVEQWAELISALPGAAAVIVFRLPAWPTVMRAVRAARRSDVPVFYDVDDLIFDADEYPDTLESYGGLLDPAAYETILFGTPLFRAALAEADFGVAPTTALARAMQPLVRSGRAFVAPNGLDSRNEPFLALPPRPKSDGEVEVVYASGTKAHNADWDALAGPALLAVMDEQPAVRLTIVGHLALSPEFDRFEGRVRRIPHLDDMGRFWDLLAGADVNLAVLRAVPATDAKSEIKWLEAAVLGIPSVVSATATYHEVLEDGRDALLAADPAEWRRALQRICADPALRREIGSNARHKAVERYALDVGARRLEELLRAGEKPRPARGKPLVLRVGGVDRRRDVHDPFSSAFEVVDLTVDPEPRSAFEVRAEPSGVGSVLRIGAPQHAAGDWSAGDPGLHRVLLGLLDGLGPDLVVLAAAEPASATVARICRALAVPYVICAADGAWLSGWLDPETRNTPGDGAQSVLSPADLSKLTARGWSLWETLSGAAGVLAASPGLAERLKQRGFEARSPEPELRTTAAARMRRPASGRVRVVHLRQCSDERRLVEAAFREGAFADIELTVVDESIEPGGSRDAVWGETPVRVMGRPSWGKQGVLLNATDVLLAPAFSSDDHGSEVQQALGAGCWVVGDRGEGAPPTGGTKLGSVSDLDALVSVLQRVDDAPDRYCQPPPPAAVAVELSRAEALVRMCRDLLASEGRLPAMDADLGNRLSRLSVERLGRRR